MKLCVKKNTKVSNLFNASCIFNRKETMKITIPKPCYENWETMTPDEKGRFCSVCSKTVHDFTKSSDEELIGGFFSGDNICGRFRDDQLGRNLSFSIAGKIALGLLGASGILATANAQEVKSENKNIVDKLRGLNINKQADDSIYRNKTIRLGAPLSKPAAKPIILFNKKRISQEEMQKLNPDKIKRINILSGEGAIKLYGKEGENGVIVIEGKK